MAMSSDKPIIWGAAAAVVAGAIALYLYSHKKPPTPPLASTPEIQATAPLAPPPPASAPLIEHPVPTNSAPGEQPAPSLNQSDQPFRAALAALPGAPGLEKLLVPDNIIRHLVVTVDNLSKKKVAVDQRPFKPTGGQFMTLANGDQLIIDPENFKRYQPFIEVVKAADTAAGGPAVLPLLPPLPGRIR